MPTNESELDLVRKLAMKLPGVEESTIQSFWFDCRRSIASPCRLSSSGLGSL